MATPENFAMVNASTSLRPLLPAIRKVRVINHLADIPMSDGVLSIFQSILNHRENLLQRLRKLKSLEKSDAHQGEVDKQRRLVTSSLGVIRALSTKLLVKGHMAKETRDILERLCVIASVKEFRKDSLLDYEERFKHDEIWVMMERRLEKEHKIKPPQWCDDPEQPLPAWAVNPEVRNLYSVLEEKRRNDRKGARYRKHVGGGGLRVPPMGCCTGPAVRYAFGALFSNLVFFSIVPLLAYFRSSCDGKSFAVCDDWPLYVLLVIFGFILLLVQWRCVRFVILPQIDITQAFKDYSLLSFSFSKRPFVIWFLVMSIFTCLSQMDTMTNGEALGKMMATAHCVEENDEHVLREAAVAAYGSFAVAHGPMLLLLLYALALLQPLYGIVSCMPIERGVDFVVGMDSEDKQLKITFKTMADGKQNHGAALMILAEITRMEAVVFKNLNYAQCKMDLWWGERSEGWEERYLHLAKVEVKRSIARFITIGLAQNAVQTYVQIVWLGLSAAATEEVDWQVLGSVVVSLVGIIVDIPDMCEVLLFSWRAQKDLPLEDVQQSLSHACDQEYRDRVLALHRNVRREILLFASLFVLYLLILTASIAKLFGVILCDSQLLHINGCARL